MMPPISITIGVRVVAGLAILAAAAVPAAALDRAAPEPPTAVLGEAGEPVSGTRHMVVTAHPLASRAARVMLYNGGSAVDATIAAQAVLGLVEPQSSGLGGGAFLLHYAVETGEITSWDGRETAPAAATAERFLDEHGDPMEWLDAVPGGLSVGVPGALRMLGEVHARHGKLDWAELFEPAIELARDGFGVSPRLSSLLSWIGPDGFSPAARDYFFNPAGEPHPLGQVIRNPAYAATLEAIARQGPDALYEGDIAEAMVSAVQEAWTNPGDMTPEDLRGYRALEREPVCADYRGYTVCGMGPPSSGGLAVQMTLAKLERFDLGTSPSPRALHLIGEALNLAFADRNHYVADPDYVDVPAGLLDADYLAERSGLIDEDATRGTAEPGTPPGARDNGEDASSETPGTSQISIVDGDGNAISMTTTIESAFGSRLMAAGFLLNNELTDFSFVAQDDEGRPIANRVEAGKRPRSSMAPTIVIDEAGNLRLVAGSPGGARIIPYVVKAVVAHIDWGLDAQAVTELFNFGSRNGPFELERMPGIEPWVDGLEAFGHDVVVVDMTSGLNLIALPGTALEGGSDPRREGAALGD